MEYPKLYKIDSKGKVRVWWMETNEDTYRTHSGTKDGKIVTSAWKTAEPKNVGRSNATTGEQQAVLEVESIYRDKTSAGTYSENEEATSEEKYFEPMLATRFDQIKNFASLVEHDDFAVSQPKLDGIRCTISLKYGMISRNGRPIVSCPHIFEALQPIFDLNSDILFDGELYNHDMHDDFNSVQSLIMQTKPGQTEFDKTKELAQFHIYDVYDYKNPDLTTEDRVNFLKYIKDFMTDLGPLVFVETKMVSNMENVDKAQAEYLENGYEGQIIRLSAPYEVGKRSKKLIKRKEFFDEEFEILRFEEGKGNWAGMVKRVVCRDLNIKTDEFPDGIEFEAGVRGSQSEMTALLAVKDNYIGSDCTIRFPNKTPGGKPRFGVMIRYYEGKRDF